MIRQGDVMLIEAENVDHGVDKKVIEPRDGRLVLAEGEATGHAHTVCAERATLFGVDERMLLVVDEQTELTHQEHATIEVAPGSYWVVRQREYTPQEIRRVAD